MEHLVTFKCDAQPKDQLQKLYEQNSFHVEMGSIGYVVRLNGDIEVWATKRAKRTAKLQ